MQMRIAHNLVDTTTSLLTASIKPLEPFEIFTVKREVLCPAIFLMIRQTV